MTPRAPGGTVAFTATLALAMAIGPFSVQAVSALSPWLVAELSLSRAELGSLATVTFAVAALGSWFGGHYVDRTRDRTMMYVVFVAGALSVLAMSQARGLAWLWAGAALSGTSQIIANPVTNRLVAAFSPIGRQGVQVGIKQSGVQMGQMVAGFVLPPLAVLAGWRPVLLLGVLLAAAGLLASARLLAPTPRPVAVRSAPSESRPPSGLGWLVAYTFTISIPVQAVNVYVPLYAYEAIGLPIAVAGMTTGMLAVAGVTARIVWTRVAERRRTPVGTMQALAAVALLSVLCVLAAEHVGGAILWPAVLGFGASALAVNAVVMLAVIRAAGGHRTGRASGIAGMAFFLGFMIGPVGCGLLIDFSGSYTVAWSVAAAFCLTACLIATLWRRAEHAA